MGVFDPDLRNLERERRLRATEDWSREVLFASWAIRDLRAARDAVDLYEWHRRLLGRFVAVQDRAGTIRTRLRRRGEGRRLADSADELHDQRYAAKAILSLYRSLGDALAWRLLRCRRGEITAIGHGRHLSQLAPAGRGRDAELDEIEWLWRERGILAIHTALTSCLREGDLLSVESWQPRKLRLSEVKASGSTPRNSRHRKQLRRLERLTTILNGEASGLDSLAPSTPVDCPVEIRTHHRSLGELIQRARSDTLAAREVEPGVAVIAIDDSDPAGLGERHYIDAWREVVETTPWLPRDADGPDTGGCSSVFRVLRNRRYSFPLLAPLSILPFDPVTVSRILGGPLRYHALFHRPRLRAMLASRGVEVEYPRGKEAETVFLVLRLHGRTIAIPANVGETITVELMTLETVADILTWAVSEIETLRGPVVAFNFPNEHLIWRVS